MTGSKINPIPPRRYRLMQAMIWPIMKSLNLSCRHFSELCSTRLDRPLTAGEKMRFRIHKMACGLCRALPKQMESLRELTRSSSLGCDHEAAPVEALEPAARQRIFAALSDKANGDE